MSGAEALRPLSLLLEAGLDRRPDAVAIHASDGTATFRELEERSNGLAAEMRDRYRVGSGDRVAFLAEARIEHIVGAVAAWKAGAIYAPIDPHSPTRRLDGMIRTLEPALLIGSATRLAHTAGSWPDVPRLAYEEIASVSRRDVFRGPEIDSSAPAFIIHTSGSTGTPKGVMLSHGSTAQYFLNQNELQQHDERTVSINNAPFHFDVSVQDTIMPLFFGGSVVFHRAVFLSSVMLGLIQHYEVTHLTAVSAVLALISQNGERIAALAGGRLRVLMTGGEICNPKLINLWLDSVPGLRVFNGYGPTECNSLCLAYEIAVPDRERVDPYPIGYPYRGMEAALFDTQHDVIAETEAVGILGVAGPQLMTGYWRDPEYTARTIRVVDGRRFYLTGDVCRRDADGSYTFVGRRDTEVKIRGQRINLAEVRNALLSHPDVRFACVAVQRDTSDARIVAYVHVNSRDEFDVNDLDRVLGDCLSAAMIPAHVCLSTSVPRTSTGKADEAAAMDIVTSVSRNPAPDRYVWVEDVATAADTSVMPLGR